MSENISDWLAGLPAAERKLGADQFLFHRGDAVRQVFVVLEGGVHLLRHQADGAAIILQRARPGSIVAEASLFSARYHCDAIAFAPTRLRAIRKGAVLERLRRGHAFAAAFAAHLAREVQQARLRSEILMLKTVAGRLDAWLAWHDGTLPEKGRWRAVALEIGVSPEALYREIARRRQRSGMTRRPRAPRA